MNLPLFMSAHLERSGSESFCIPLSLKYLWQAIFFYITFHMAVVFYISIAVLSILTLRRISKTQAIENSLSEIQRQQRRRRIINAVKVVLYSLLVYTCCSLPFLIGLLLWFLVNYCIDWSTLFFFAWSFLPLVNSFVSPAIYCVCLSDFREAARGQLRKLLCYITHVPQLERRNPVVPRNRRTENTRM